MGNSNSKSKSKSGRVYATDVTKEVYTMLFDNIHDRTINFDTYTNYIVDYLSDNPDAIIMKNNEDITDCFTPLLTRNNVNSPTQNIIGQPVYKTEYERIVAERNYDNDRQQLTAKDLFEQQIVGPRIFNN
jgi:hypothetical protein